MPVHNYFDRVDAEKYTRARPNIHPAAVETIGSFAGIDVPVSLALDIGSGTGQSSVALTEIAGSVIGIEPSSCMLTQALTDPNVSYVQAKAEDIPLADQQFDLITAAQAFHWFDHEAFLTESRRLLRIPGWLVIYNGWFTGQMKENRQFASWFKDEYLRRYPAPARNRTAITKDLAQRHGFALRGEGEFSNEVKMTADRFTDYELSTTNMIAAVDRNQLTFSEGAKWLHESLVRFFEENLERTFLFSGKIWYLEKTGLLS